MDEIKPTVKPERLEKGALKREAVLLEAMVRDYCKRHHNDPKGLCDDCRAFLVYALTRLACCPYGEKKAHVRQMQNSLLSGSRKRNRAGYHA